MCGVMARWSPPAGSLTDFNRVIVETGEEATYGSRTGSSGKSAISMRRF
jgi:hypothetical protein